MNTEKLKAWVEVEALPTTVMLPGFYACLCDYGEGEHTLEAREVGLFHQYAEDLVDTFRRASYRSPVPFQTEEAAIWWGYENDPDW